MMFCLACVSLAAFAGSQAPGHARNTGAVAVLSEPSGATASGERVGMNALFVIFPYKQQGTWVFDDPRVGLSREPFVSGADEILDLLSAGIPDARNGIKLVFSATPFPGYTARFIRTREEYGGNWYRWPEKGMDGWLCPALFKYFDKAPETLFVKASPKDR